MNRNPFVRHRLPFGAQNAALEPLLHERDAAAVLGVSVAWMRRCRWAGTGPEYVKLNNGSVRYEPTALVRYIDQNRRATCAAALA
jgi:hypothetical protein